MFVLALELHSKNKSPNVYCCGYILYLKVLSSLFNTLFQIRFFNLTKDKRLGLFKLFISHVTM